MPYDFDKDLLEKAENRFEDAQDDFEKSQENAKDGMCTLALDQLVGGVQRISAGETMVNIADNNKTESRRESGIGAAAEKSFADKKQRRAEKTLRRQCMED